MNKQGSMDNMADITGIRKQLEKKLKAERYEHTLGVMYTAASLAMRYGGDIQKALLAGILHDCGKYAAVKEQMKLCREYKIQLTQPEQKIPALIHAKLGAYLAEHEYNIKDAQVLDAIAYHTTGRPDMALLEKIVYIADYIEPGRQQIKGLYEVRRAAFADIDEAVALSSEATISYLESEGRDIDPLTLQTYEFYKKGR